VRKLSFPLRQALVFLTVFLTLRVVFEASTRALLSLAGWSRLSLLQFLAENEAGLQILSIAGAISLVALVEKRINERTQERFFDLELPHKSWPQIWFRAFLGFLVCAGLVALSTFLGFSQIEAPSEGFARVFWLLPWIAFQGGYLLLWLAVLEALRYEVFRKIFESKVSSFVSFVFAVVFESYLLFSIVEANSVSQVSFAGVGLCLLLSIALNLSFMETLFREKVRGDSFYGRVFFLWGLTFSFLSLFGQNVASWRAASILQLFPGPLEVSSVYFYIAVVVLIANTAFQRLLKQRNQQA